ncbi:S-layer homology domain-containing protein [Paenibacillus sp. GCM10012303]|uniref:S-layer homology domain-containing protein n=1 Tax=Paenibacillus sp. GCM10012303 TaxID=3317340 RepID=UPI0036090235
MLPKAMRKFRKAAAGLLIASIAVTAAVPLLPAVPAQAAAADVVPRSFSPPEDIGTMVTTPAVVDSSYGFEDGKPVLYTTVTGNPNVADNPAYFNVVDLSNYGLIRSLPLVGGGQSWGHVVDAQGQVYITSAKYLFRYSPVTKTVTNLGSPAGSSTLYGLTVDEQGVVYGGTYPTGAVFKYDPRTNQLSDYGKMTPATEYVRAIEYYNGFLYAGTGAIGELYKMNPADGSKTRIPFPANAGFTPGNEPTVYAMSVVRDFLFIHMSSTPNKLLIYDLTAEEWLPDVVDNYRGMYVSPELNGKTYYVADGKFHSFDLDTRVSAPTGAVFGSYFRRGAWVDVQGDPELPGKSLVTVLFNGAVALANFTTNVVKSWMPVVPGTPVSIQSLEFGPDGLLYSTGYQGSYGARYNIVTGEKELFSMGQAEGMIAYGDKMIFGEYPSAHMHELDTTKPLERGVNPRQIHEIGFEQDRPFVLTTGDNKLFTGTVPKLGKLGGAISVYDGTAWETFRNVVDNQSIMGLAYRNGKLYGSTTVWGGLGIEPAAQEAKMFVWDVAAKQKVAEFVPEIRQAGGTKPKAIGGLAFGPDGLLWGAAYGTIFAMNPDTYEIVKQKEITSTDWVFDHSWVPVKLRWDAEGILYTTLGSQIVAVDPSTMAFAKIPGTKTNLMVLGPDGNLYYNEASVLKKITVSKERPPVYTDVEVPIVNGGFEQTNADGMIPGWDRFGYRTGEAEYYVTQEQANGGQNSLKIADTSAAAETGVISIPFPVTPGLEYTGKADIYLSSGRTIFSMKYYDAAGKEIKVTPAPANYFSSPSQRWAKADFSSIAPEGAVTGKLVLFCSLAWVGTSYFDNVQLFKKVATEAPPQGPSAQELDVANPGFEQSLAADGTIPGWSIRKPETLTGKQAAVEVSADRAKSGLSSLRLFDNETALEVAVDSALIPVIGGRTYTASLDVYRTSNPPGRSSNRPILQVRYHDASGKELAVVPGVAMSKEITSAMNQWDTVTLETPAPAGAKFIRLILIGASSYVASVYADNASVTTVVLPEERTSLSVSRDPVSHVAQGDAISFEVTATNGSTILVKEGGAIVAQAVGAGEANPVTVTIPAPAPGTHLYKAYSVVDGIGKSGTVDLPAVTVHPLTALAFDTLHLDMKPGGKHSVRVRGTYGPLAYDVSPQAELSAAPAGIVSISGTELTAHAAGSAVVQAVYGGSIAHMTVTVSEEEPQAPVLNSIELELAKTHIEVGETVTTFVYGQFDNGHRFLVPDGVTLSSNPGGIVSVDGWNVTGMQAGSTIVTAVYGGKSSAVSVTVASITPEPSEPDTDDTSPGPGAPSEPVPQPSPVSEGRQQVKESDLRPKDGKTSLTLQADNKELILPVHAIELLKDSVLEISKNNVVVRIPAKLLEELSKALGVTADSGAQIALTIDVLSGSEIGGALSAGAGASNHITIRPAGEAVRLELSAVRPDGSKSAYTRFNQPIQLSLKFDDSRDAELLGIYYIADDGTVHYAGGQRNGDKLDAELTHFSMYAVLEYDRTYADVPVTHWAYPAIRSLSAKQVVQGVTEQNFAPGDTVTRAQFVAMLVRTFGLTNRADTAMNRFRDVRKDDWHYPVISAAVAEGIVDGVDLDRFDPDSPITREQMALMLTRAWTKKYGSVEGEHDLAMFRDASAISEWALEAIRVSVARGWMQGRSAEELEPAATATRAESAQLLVNVLGDK